MTNGVESDKERNLRLQRKVAASHDQMYPAIGFGDLVYLVRLATAYQDLYEAAIPCQSCGADPRISPASGEELPVVKGALDEQAQAEKACWAAQREAEELRTRLRAAESTIMDLRAGMRSRNGRTI